MPSLRLDFSKSRLTLIQRAALSCGLAVMSCGRPPTDQECLALLERYAELLARVNMPDATSDDLERIKTSARTEAFRRDPGWVDCRRKVSRRALECALSAPSVDEMERCLL